MNTYQKRFNRTALSICIAGLLSPTVMAAEENKDIERIIVTGSNIFKGSANTTSSAPITEVGSEVIEGIGAISIGDALSKVPSVTSAANGSTGNISVGGGAADIGVATAALRNLGAERTLVLVNGRRYVSGVSANNGYGVDLNSIPTAIIERVDVLTGGQSAIYGSDAIAGVINIITKKDFEALKSMLWGLVPIKVQKKQILILPTVKTLTQEMLGFLLALQSKMHLCQETETLLLTN